MRTSRSMRWIAKGTPMLVLGRHSFDAAGEPVEWVTSWYRGDRITLVAQMTAPR